MGAVVRRVRRLPARAACDVRAAQRGDRHGTLPDGTTGMSYRGETVYRGTATGCLAERVVVTEQVALPLRRRRPARPGGTARCAVLTGVGAVLYAAQRRRPGASVLVIGAGGVGQFVVQGARIAGAARSSSATRSPARLDAARERGRDARRVAGRAPRADPAELPDGADFAFDAVGDPATIATALRFDPRRRHGRDRRAAAAGAAARPRPVRADPEGEAAHGHDLRVGGSGRLAPRDARARPARVVSSSRARSARRSRSTGSTTRCRPAWRASPAGSSSSQPRSEPVREAAAKPSLQGCGRKGGDRAARSADPRFAERAAPGRLLLEPGQPVVEGEARSVRVVLVERRVGLLGDVELRAEHEAQALERAEPGAELVLAQRVGVRGPLELARARAACPRASPAPTRLAYSAFASSSSANAGGKRR